MSIKILSDNEIKIYLTNIRCFDISWFHVFFFMLFVKQFDVTYGWYFVSRSYIGLHNKYCFMKGGDGYYEKIIYIIHNGICAHVWNRLNKCTNAYQICNRWRMRVPGRLPVQSLFREVEGL